MSRSPILALWACACWGAPAIDTDEVTQLKRELATCLAGEAVPAGPDLETIAGWLVGAGDRPEALGEVLKVPREAGGHAYAMTVQIDHERHLVYLATSGLMSLHDTSGDAGVVMLLTNMATLNYENMEGKLQLNPATGEVVLSIELETDDGLGQRTFTTAVKALQDQAAALRPKLIGAATSAEL